MLALLLAALLMAPATRPSQAERAMAVAETPGLSADDIESAIKSMRYPAPDDWPRPQDGEAYYDFLDELQALNRAAAALHLRFVEDFPDHPRARGHLLVGVQRRTSVTPTTSGRPSALLEAGRAVIAELRETHGGRPDLAAVLDASEVRLAVEHGGLTVAEVEAEVDRLRPVSPDNPLLPDLLSHAAALTEDQAEKRRLLTRLVEEFPGSGHDRAALGDLRRMDGPGQAFEFAFDDAVTGRRVTSEALRGQVIVVDFWATWCGPCVAAMPEMKRLHAGYKDRGVAFVGISLDLEPERGGRDDLLAFVEEHGIDWPQQYDGQGWGTDLAQAWGVPHVPSVFVVGRDGTLLHRDAGGDLDAILADLADPAGE